MVYTDQVATEGTAMDIDPRLLGIALGPLFALVVFGIMGTAIKVAIARHVPDGWIKRQLLAERFESTYSAGNGRIREECARYTSRRK